jgi:LmbE family N-acetylglucosaminyl deacetylase
MRTNLRRVFAVVALALPATLAGPPARAQSLPEALEAIHRARVTTRILYITAHPDDEFSSLLAYLAHGLGADTALLTLTRGEGGQNAIGPEMGAQLGMIRTEELLEATQVEGVRLYFTRAPDFGYSKTLEETLRIWGDVALGDMVRVIRTFRPHVVINGWGGVDVGHGNHQASKVLTPKAFAAAGDPNAFPEQLAEGLRPWKPTLLLEPLRRDFSEGWRVPVEQISLVWGKSYTEIGLEGFVHHRSQGVAAFLGSPFLSRPVRLARPDGGGFDPQQLAEPLAALALPGVSGSPLGNTDRALEQAREAALRLDWASAVAALAQAGRIMAELEAQLGRQTGDAAAAARWELARVREHVDAALAAAVALRVEARADRGEIVAGENFSVRARVRRRAEVPGEFAKPALMLPPGWSVSKEETEPNGAVRFTVAIPNGAEAPHSPTDWMLPWPPPLVTARVHAVVEGYAFDAAAPVQAQRATSTHVNTLPLTLVPAVTLTLEPQQFVVSEKRPAKPLELLARVRFYGTSPAKVAVGLDVPDGWRASSSDPLEFAGAGDQLARFTVTPPAKIAAGNYALKAWASRDGEKFRMSLESVPSLPTRLWSEPAVVVVRAFDVAVPEGLRVGYVAAENDPIPAALSQLGVQVELLDPVALAFGDLRRFDAIAIGIRAYELREGLGRANRRLLDYAAAGGTLLVQYQREGVWNALKPAPYPAAIGQPAVRITDEDSPVRFLAPESPVLNFPNKISLEDFKGWVQDRGLYFWSQWDPRYQPVLAMRDPGEPDVNGALLYARCGKGVYIYTGLAFFRQLPEGVPGAYRLFINLLSQSKAK